MVYIFICHVYIYNMICNMSYIYMIGYDMYMCVFV